MRRMIPFLVAAALTVGAGYADTSGSYRQMAQSIWQQVEEDLRRTDLREAPLPGRSDFDPLVRAREKLSAWTQIPAEQELVGYVPGGRAEYGRSVDPYAAPDELVREYFPRLGEALFFPPWAETAGAIRRMAQGQVSATPNRCARTLREALGWGLGDAAQWVTLPKRGYRQRPSHVDPLPGDILVWPFTFGSRNRQHVGIAVGTSPGIRLLSNVNGRLGLSQILPGYRAYWK